MSTMSSNLQLRSISSAMSSGGLLSHKSRRIAFGNPSCGRLPGQLLKLELSRPVLAITNVGRHVSASFSPVTWLINQRPVIWGLMAAKAILLYILLCILAFHNEHPPVNWGMITVSQGMVYVIERFGKYYKTLTTPGFHFLIPFVYKVAYVHYSYKAIHIPDQSNVITKDGFILDDIGGVLYVQLVDPVLASYGVAGDPLHYMTGLASASIRSEVGKMDGQMIVDERDTLNQKILISINENECIKRWGFQCVKFNIWGLNLLRLMILEHKERVHLLGPTGGKQASHAFKLAARGDADATIIAISLSIAEDIKMVSENLKAIAEDIKMVSKNLKAEGGVEVAAKVFAMQENLGLLTDPAANPCAMKCETDQASLPQSKQT